MNKYLKRSVNGFFYFLIFLIFAMPIFSQTAGITLTIKLYNSTARRNIALFITDENTGIKLYAMSYSGGSEINGTDSGGNFIRIVEGANPAHTYTVTLLVDVDNDGSVNQFDVGKTITGINGGATWIIDSLSAPTSLDVLSLAPGQIPILANQRAGCILSEQSFSYSNSIVAGKSYGFSAISEMFFDSAGNFNANSIMAPPGNHSNVLCVVDMNHNNILDAGDYYSIGSRVGSSNTNYALGAWSVIP